MSSFSFYVLVSLLIIISIKNVVSHVHRCVHDEIDHKISQQFVPYNNHPYDSNSQNRRDLSEVSEQYKPIRIRPYYDPILINNNTLSNAKINYIKSLVSAAINYFEQFVKVIPVSGPLLVSRCNHKWLYDAFAYTKCELSEYTEPLKCLEATIPDEHIAESWYYDPATAQSTLYKEGGKGISDADLVVYVTYGQLSNCVGNGTLRWAAACNLDQFGRPVVGTINFCPIGLKDFYWKYDVHSTLHELTHVLALSNGLYGYYYDKTNNQRYGSDNVVIDAVTSNTNNAWIITDKVKEIAKSHFDCDSILGAPLENAGGSGTAGSHFEGKYMQYENMVGIRYSAVAYVSDFTLALMEDTGWYQIDYNYSQSFYWGYHEGCDFINGDCINKTNTNTDFPQYWCTSPNADGCSFDYSTVAHCIIYAYSGSIPEEFKYFTDETWGGPSAHDYCSFRDPQTDSIHADYEEICYDIRGNNFTTFDIPTTTFGIDSRCVEVDDTGSSADGYCFKHECIGYDSINKMYNGVNIIISDGVETITCLRNESLTTKQSSTYSVSIKCPNIDTICGKSTAPFDCYWGEYNDELQRCVCSVGYVDDICSTKDINNYVIEATVNYTLNITSQLPDQSEGGVCITNSLLSSSITGYYEYDGKYEGIPSYYSQELNKYLYFIRSFSRWNIGDQKGDTSIYSYCRQAIPLSILEIMDIQDCDEWISYYNSEWSYDTDIIIDYCIPTKNPTNAPTTSSPTNAPTTSSPTNSPVTSSPTTISPTNFPVTTSPTITGHDSIDGTHANSIITHKQLLIIFAIICLIYYPVQI